MSDNATPPSSPPPPLLDYRPLDRHRPSPRRVLSYATCFASILAGAVVIANFNHYVSLVLAGFAFIVAGGFGLYAIQPPPLHVTPVSYRLLAVASAASAICGSIPIVISLLPVSRDGRIRSWPIGKLAWFILSLVAYVVARRLITLWIRSHDPADWTPRALRRRQVQIWSLATLTFLAICSVPGVVICYDRISLHLDFRNAMAHALPPGKVVFTDDPGESKRLVQADPLGYSLRYPILPPVPASAPVPSHAIYTSESLSRSPLGRNPLLFLHTRQPPGQPPVLVAVTLHTATRSDGTGITEFLATAYRSPAWRQPDWPAPCAAARLTVPISPSDRLRILAGQPDPAHPARFTVPVEVNGLPHQLAGALDAAGQLRLTWSAPTTSPVPHDGQPP